MLGSLESESNGPVSFYCWDLFRRCHERQDSFRWHIHSFLKRDGFLRGVRRRFLDYRCRQGG